MRKVAERGDSAGVRDEREEEEEGVYSVEQLLVRSEKEEEARGQLSTVSSAPPAGAMEKIPSPPLSPSNSLECGCSNTCRHSE